MKGGRTTDAAITRAGLLGLGLCRRWRQAGGIKDEFKPKKRKKNQGAYPFYRVGDPCPYKI